MEFWVQIPTLANAKTDDKRGFESPSKRDRLASRKQMHGCDFEALSHLVEEAAYALPQSRLEELKSILHRAYVKRFMGKRKTPKYGSLNKGFTEPELRNFLHGVSSAKFRLLFGYQAYLGLRVGEVCRLHLDNIDFDKRELTIKSEKSAVSDSLLIPLDLFKETVEYIAKNADQIKAANGYVFYKDNDNNHNEVTHVDQNYARKVFREAANAVGLGQVYDYSEECDAHRRPRPLYRITTHSLRHYAITRFAKSTNGNVVLASRFARHSNPIITMRYIAKDNEQLYREIDGAFGLGQAIALKRGISKRGNAP